MTIKLKDGYKKPVPQFALKHQDPVDYIFGDGKQYAALRDRSSISVLKRGISPRRLRSKDERLISQAGVYLNPIENCPVSKNLITVQ